MTASIMNEDMLLYHYPKYAIVIGPTRVTCITVDRCSGAAVNITGQHYQQDVIPCIRG